jgi:hypothetical protein
MWCSGHTKGAHNSAVISDGEDGVVRLNRQGEVPLVGSIGTQGCGEHGSKVNWTEVVRGGRIKLELLTAAMASGGRRRTEGVLLVLEEGKRGRGQLQDG